MQNDWKRDVDVNGTLDEAKDQRPSARLFARTVIEWKCRRAGMHSGTSGRSHDEIQRCRISGAMGAMERRWVIRSSPAGLPVRVALQWFDAGFSVGWQHEMFLP